MDMAVSQPVAQPASSGAVSGSAAARQAGATTGASGQSFQQVMGSVQTSTAGGAQGLDAAAAQNSAAAGDGSAQAAAAALLQAAQSLLAGVQENGATAPAAGEAVVNAPAATGEAAAAEQAPVIDSDDLLQQLGELLDQLFADGEEQLELSQQEWQSAASELSALLALLGLPVQQLLVAQGGESADGLDISGAGAAGSGAKGAVVESLLMLSQALEAGKELKIGNQAAAGTIQQQLGKLESLLKGGPNAVDGDKLSPIEGQGALGKGTAANAPAAAALLARMNASSVHVRAAVEAQQSTPSAPAAGGVEAGAAAGANAPAAAPQEQIQSFVAVNGSSAPGTVSNAAAPAAAVPVVNVHKFAEEMGGLMLQKLSITSSDQAAEARIVLNPEHLGQVDIKLYMQNGHLTATFLADTPAAREAIENQLAQLRQTLQLQGIQVERMEVSSQLQASLSFGQQGQSGGQQRQGSAGDRAASEESAVREADAAVQTAIRELGFGRAVNATA
ncbi:flagellar hook-length control protein FliK [Paenibacillus pasadenensis]|uniref:flagellar hook-length control protein FliK n=1 Tax=Paenibacillus pasadenensis TaxID=217090 RepID=UPI0020412D14|nr:flagellar hook-length control protein FliK [Paenibacillus pasadenensis]MCM3746007.1 flagellar hook-length control protein FliK [Paenibacillus pasadenensis]